MPAASRNARSGTRRASVATATAATSPREKGAIRCAVCERRTAGGIAGRIAQSGTDPVYRREPGRGTAKRRRDQNRAPARSPGRRSASFGEALMVGTTSVVS